ncbi:hypothetical protein PACTADRAFT_51724 [Pachysolen tannophilus NRRL Y-2460]|uniref:Large ribosomal subunit protein mL44 n=1 Tax=Pachysolen tannophilus NRRL Y-2460 TaxID=669874 RepID=A0A1E4TQF0_PACTA|nr:hypothetical protein PACTADRAFT_51724 [Pachysolen tannophilus NRRL Y-2460]
MGSMSRVLQITSGSRGNTTAAAFGLVSSFWLRSYSTSIRILAPQSSTSTSTSTSTTTKSSTASTTNASSNVSDIAEENFSKIDHSLTPELTKNSNGFTKIYKTPKKLDDFGSYERISFESKISEEEAKLSPPLLALHSRLELPSSFKYSTLARCLICRNKKIENKIADNFGLSVFGKNVLVYYITEYLLVNYPRLPISILNSAVDGYIGKFSLYDVGKIWGIEEETRSEVDRFLSDEPKEYIYGKLKYEPSFHSPEDGVVELTNNKGIDRASAYSHAVCAIVAGYYAHEGPIATKNFIKNHILSRKLNLSELFEFTEPILELSKLCKRENLKTPTSRLIAETGRLSNSPVFVVGVFSGEEKLGEGQGASLIEAKVRAAVQALKAYYLYRPLDPIVPSDDVHGGFKPVFADKGEVVI